MGAGWKAASFVTVGTALLVVGSSLLIGRPARLPGTLDDISSAAAGGSARTLHTLSDNGSWVTPQLLSPGHHDASVDATVERTRRPPPTVSTRDVSGRQGPATLPPLRDTLPRMLPMFDPALLSEDSDRSIDKVFRFVRSHSSDTTPARAAQQRHHVITLPQSVTGGVSCVGAVYDVYPSCGDASADVAPVTKDPDVAEWIAKRVGPFAFHVAVTGPAIITKGATLFDHVGAACEYIHLFRVPADSSSSLTIRRVLSRYRAVDEVTDTVSVFDKVDVFGARLNACKDAEVPSRGSPNSGPPPITAWRGTDVDALRAAAASHPPSGLRYFPWRHKEFVLDVRGSAMLQSHVTPIAAAKACSREGKAARRILFTGDSHVRVLFRHFESMSFNVVASTKKGGNMSTYRVSENTPPDSIRRPRTVLGSAIEADYLWDPYLEELPRRWSAEVAPAYAAVVVGTGAWPASFGQWTMRRFATAMSKIAKEIQRPPERGVTRPVVFWVGGPAIPKPRQMPGFRITNYRLGVFNSIGGRMMTAAGGHWIDVFSMTYAVPKWHRGDGMHFDQSVVPYAAVDWILSTWCRN